eukprot:TRINITY_DN5170_c0_g1_i1.p1 TRINITY_DN5170_c0_g1~~TRINITY_DN5170_c0_g1_i1.p1  ORF type:complete len:160 (+),score=25.33 TRINITY_DN5170_c0_g1_i1:575-1054(+)
METQQSKAGIKTESEVLRVIMMGALGTYAATHLYFLPQEIALLVKFTNPYLIYYIYILMLFLALKYTVLLEILLISIKKMDVSVISMLLLLIVLLVLTLLGCTMHMVYAGIAAGSLIDSPYLLDYLGCVVCGILGALYNGIIILKQRKLFYRSVPVSTV